MRAKSFIFINSLFFCLLLHICCQSTSKSIYGNWYKVVNGTIDTRDTLYDLVIRQNGSVRFKQETFKSPCRYEFNGFHKSDSIFYTSKLYCLDLTTKEEKFKYAKMDTFLMTSIVENHLVLVNKQTKQKTEYMKRKID